MARIRMTVILEKTDHQGTVIVEEKHGSYLGPVTSRDTEALAKIASNTVLAVFPDFIGK